MSRTGLIDLVTEEPEWQRALPELEETAELAARLALEAAGLRAEGWEVAVLACSDARIAELNREFRGTAGPTNVLSWPALELAADRPGGLPKSPLPVAKGPRRPLGDVAIALQTSRREAAEGSIPLKDHVAHLILHACLHLLGFDHGTGADADLMEGIETRALARIGVADPHSGGGGT